MARPRTGPKERVDLDLDALAPQRRSIRKGGRVLYLPGDIGIASIVRALQLQESLSVDDEAVAKDAVEEMLDIIFRLFADANPEFSEEDFDALDLTLSDVMNLLGLVLSGMDMEMQEAVKHALEAGIDDQPKEEQEEDGRPPTSPQGGRTVRARTASAARRSRSTRPSRARS